MYKCQCCGEQQQVGVKQHKQVLQTRRVTYNNNGKISEGTEIVKERNICQTCEDQPYALLDRT